MQCCVAPSDCVSTQWQLKSRYEMGTDKCVKMVPQSWLNPTSAPVLHRDLDNQTLPVAFRTQTLRGNFLILSGHKRHPVPSSKFRPCDVIAPEKIIAFYPCNSTHSFIQCLNLAMRSKHSSHSSPKPERKLHFLRY